MFDVRKLWLITLRYHSLAINSSLRVGPLSDDIRRTRKKNLTRIGKRKSGTEAKDEERRIELKRGWQCPVPIHLIGQTMK
jgi:hypothetical protein